MDFRDSPDELAYRQTVRDWLAVNAEPVAARTKFSVVADLDEVRRAKDWQAKKAAGGYAGLTIAKEYGGAGEPAIKQVIYDQEEANFDVPRGAIDIGLGMCIPTVIAWGSDAHRERYVRKALSAEEIWCQLFSEPSGGSDVASLRTRAVQTGSDWTLNGQKVWTSGAHYSDFGIVLARTDANVAKHKGLTMFIVNMRAPGIEVRPIKSMAGSAEFNEVFFSDVVIPDSDRLGEPGQGWSVALSTLMHERMKAGRGFGFAGWDALLQVAKETQLAGTVAIQDGRVRDRVAQVWAQEQALRLLSFRAQTALSQGAFPGPEQAVNKLVEASLAQDTNAFALDLVGEVSVTAADPQSPWHLLYNSWVWASGMRIAGGADEILRNIIAERVLGLPGDARPDKNKPFNQL